MCKFFFLWCVHIDKKYITYRKLELKRAVKDPVVCSHPTLLLSTGECQVAIKKPHSGS